MRKLLPIFLFALLFFLSSQFVQTAYAAPDCSTLLTQGSLTFVNNVPDPAQCTSTCYIAVAGGYNCEQATVVTPTPTPTLIPLNPPAPPAGGGSDPCPGGTCQTGFGFGISTDPGVLISKFFAIILSIAGGIALILIIISGYNLMASQGNPEKVQAAREGLTSAITGLLFIVFSLVILQFIGVNILHIPSFHP